MVERGEWLHLCGLNVEPAHHDGDARACRKAGCCRCVCSPTCPYDCGGECGCYACRIAEDEALEWAEPRRGE